MNIVDWLTIVSLITSVVSIVMTLVFGVLAIWITWTLYRAGADQATKTLEILKVIEASAKTTEYTSHHFTERLLDSHIRLLGRDISTTLSNSQQTLSERMDFVLAKLLGGKVNEKELEDVKAHLREEIRGTFRSAKFEAGLISPLSGEPSASTQSTAGSVTTPASVPTMPRLLLWVADNEPPKNKFLSVKFVRERVFKNDVAMQEALQSAIDQGLLDTYREPNPKNPSFLTTCVKLNRNHPVVKEVLDKHQ